MILFVILTRIDFGQLRALASSADVALVLAGIVMIIPTVVFGALRWHVLLRRCDSAAWPYSRSISEYWKSLAVGVLIPGSLGSDGYRVMMVGKENGRYLRNAFVVVLEKFAALVSCGVLIGTLYPLLTPNNLPPIVMQIIDALYLVLIAGGLAVPFVLLVRRQQVMARLGSAVLGRLMALARRASGTSGGTPGRGGDWMQSAGMLLRMLVSLRVVLPALSLSLAIHVFSSAQSHVLFQAFAFEIPFSVNLFVTPLLVLLYSLPISFAGIGVREGASILAYGAFGVPAEIALIVSFCSLLSNLFSYGIGAGIFFLTRPVEAPA